MKDLFFRPLSPEDSPLILELFQSYQKGADLLWIDYSPNFYKHHSLISSHPALTIGFFQKSPQKEQILGSLTRLISSYKFQESSPIYYYTDLIIHSQFRKQGLKKLIIEEVNKSLKTFDGQELHLFLERVPGTLSSTSYLFTNPSTTTHFHTSHLIEWPLLEKIQKLVTPSIKNINLYNLSVQEKLHFLNEFNQFQSLSPLSLQVPMSFFDQLIEMDPRASIFINEVNGQQVAGLISIDLATICQMRFNLRSHLLIKQNLCHWPFENQKSSLSPGGPYRSRHLGLLWYKNNHGIDLLPLFTQAAHLAQADGYHCVLSRPPSSLIKELPPEVIQWPQRLFFFYNKTLTQRYDFISKELINNTNIHPDILFL